jgi:NAD(P)-dependent dehydrogenase (short-subunit alcohol dehydrogenase family)
MMFGPAEAFTPKQYAQQYDVNVLGTQRVNRAVLPHMRAQKQGLLVWMSSSSPAGGTPPYLSRVVVGTVMTGPSAKPICRHRVQ